MTRCIPGTRAGARRRSRWASVSFQAVKTWKTSANPGYAAKKALHPPKTRIAIICDNFSPHLTTRKDKRVGQWAAASNVEIAYTPTNSSWMNRIPECQFTALREFTLNGTDHATHREQGGMIRRYIAWRNRNTNNTRLRRIVDRANVA